jgi:SAM-dependent methyltransferase
MNAEAVKALERAGWCERAESYGLLTGRITSRFVEPMLDAAGASAGMRLLDVGSGPGDAARRASERGAVATGVDIADEFLALARRRHRGVRFLRADAEDLPFPDRTFDAVVCGFSVQHFPQPERAMGELARVAVPGGTIALSTWDRPERNRFLGILVDALRACGVVRLETGPDPYRFADDDELRALLHSAGLVDVRVRPLSLSHVVSDAEELWQGLLGGSVRTAGLVLEQPPAARGRIRAAVERLAEEHRAGGELEIPVRAKLAHGRRP